MAVTAPAGSPSAGPAESLNLAACYSKRGIGQGQDDIEMPLLTVLLLVERGIGQDGIGQDGIALVTPPQRQTRVPTAIPL